MKTWLEIRNKYSYGDLIEGIVVHHAPFGVFLDIGERGVLGLMGRGPLLDEGIIEKYPKIGSKIKGVIVAFVEENRQIRLSSKPEHMANAFNWIDTPDEE